MENTFNSIESICKAIASNAFSVNVASKSELITIESERMKDKEYLGKYRNLKRVVVSIKPIRYIIAKRRCTVIESFRKEETRVEIHLTALKDLIENKDKYIETFEMLDDTSKKVYLNMLLCRLTGNYLYAMKVCSSKVQYFSDRIIWKDAENIVDCGAFTGDTLQAFMNSKIRIKNYYLYELDDGNYQKMIKTCDCANRQGIHTFPKKSGVYNQSKTLYFEADADSSRIVDYETQNQVAVVSIDEDIHDTVTFIKMDIEGSELEAIDGAKKTIRKYKPTLAICIYHKQSDFWQIPLRIKEICPEYNNFWIEQYSPWDMETVFFASV